MGLEKLMILDWDVHHGNGSQHIFWADRDVMYASTHQVPLFPGTGATGERGDHDTIVNAPHPAPVALRHVIGHMLPDTVYDALDELLPGTVHGCR